MKPIYKRVRD